MRAALDVSVFLPVLERRVGGLCPTQWIVAIAGFGRVDLLAFRDVVGQVLHFRQLLPSGLGSITPFCVPSLLAPLSPIAHRL